MTPDPNRARVEVAEPSPSERLARAMDALLTGVEESEGWKANALLYREGHAALQNYWSADALPSQADAQLIAELQAEVVRLREGLAEVKLLCLTAGSIGHPTVVRALQRMLRICIDAGVTQQLPDLIRAALEHKEADRG